jgi:hypothetical protein
MMACTIVRADWLTLQPGIPPYESLETLNMQPHLGEQPSPELRP